MVPERRCRAPAFNFSRLLPDASNTDDGHLGVVSTTLAEGVDGAAPHHHGDRSELFYVIEGEIDVLAGDQVQAGKGRRRGRPAWLGARVRRPARGSQQTC